MSQSLMSLNKAIWVPVEGYRCLQGLMKLEPRSSETSQIFALEKWKLEPQASETSDSYTSQMTTNLNVFVFLYVH